MAYVGINILNHNKYNMFWGLLKHWGWIWERIPTASFSKIFQCSRALAKRSYRGLLHILTSWHHVANILNSESRVFIFSVDTNHTKAQPIHGQYGSSRQRCSRDPRPLKDTQIKMPNQTYKLNQTLMKISKYRKMPTSVSFLYVTDLKLKDGSRDFPQKSHNNKKSYSCAYESQIFCQVFSLTCVKHQLPGQMILVLYIYRRQQQTEKLWKILSEVTLNSISDSKIPHWLCKPRAEKISVHFLKVLLSYRPS